MTSNADIVLDQFTRQAAPFANSAAMRDEDAIIDVSSYPAADEPPIGLIGYSSFQAAIQALIEGAE